MKKFHSICLALLLALAYPALAGTGGGTSGGGTSGGAAGTGTGTGTTGAGTDSGTGTTGTTGTGTNPGTGVDTGPGVGTGTGRGELGSPSSAGRRINPSPAPSTEEDGLQSTEPGARDLPSEDRTVSGTRGERNATPGVSDPGDPTLR